MQKFNEFKAYTQYLGCQVFIPENYGFDGMKTDAKQGVFSGIKDDFIRIDNISGFYPFKNFPLILKPLLEITDEDCSILANLNPIHRWRGLISKWNGKSDEGLVAIVKEDLDNIIEFEEACVYLREQGYDFPNNYLNGQTLEEHKLAVYKK